MTPDEPLRDVALTAEDRAAARAFLARCEVRMSTLHRIAVGMLSGAGLLVVLPVVARDSVTGILRSLVSGGVDVTDGFLIVAVIAMLAVPVTALWWLFRDLTRFYFHANHLEGERGAVFTPRFTLTSLRLPSDELEPGAAGVLDSVRSDPRMVELLVPTNDASRRRIDVQLDVYGGLSEGIGDEARANGLMALAAARSRPLLEEVAKFEYGMARHVLKLRGLVLRYVKALLALLTTALAVYAGDAVVVDIGTGDDLTTSAALWLAAIVLVWAPVVVLALTSPIRWIEDLMRDDGAPSTAVADDPELTFVERISLRIAAVAWVASIVAMVIALSSDTSSAGGRWAGALVLAASVLAVVIAALTGRFRSLVTTPV
jgi:hypothetical protein